MSPQEFIFGMLSRRVKVSSLPWLERTASQFKSSGDDGALFASFSAAIRFSGKAPLAPDASESAEAERICAGWNLADWTLDQAARIYLLLSLPPDAHAVRLLDALYRTADLGESLALMKALPLLPNPAAHIGLAREGARSNVKSQFEAIALRNPFPARCFDEIAWNQMVCKAIFIGSTLREIQGLDIRANRALNQILFDLVRERRAAGRTFDPWLYRCTAPIAEGSELDELEAILETGTPPERSAAYAGLLRNPSPRAAGIAGRFSEAISALAGAEPSSKDADHAR
jgi:hypothetical protein